MLLKRLLFVMIAGLSAYLASPSRASADAVEMTPISDGSVKWKINPAGFKDDSMSVILPTSRTSKEIYFARESYRLPGGCLSWSQWIPLAGPTALLVFPDMTLATSFYNLSKCGEKCWRDSTFPDGFDMTNPLNASVVKDLMTVQVQVDNGSNYKMYEYKVSTRGMTYTASKKYPHTYDLTRKTSSASANPLVFQPVVTGTRFRINMCNLVGPAALYLRGATVWAYPTD